MTAIVDTAFPRFFTPDRVARDPSLVERSRHTFLSTDPRGYAGCCAALRDAALRPAIGDIEVPSLILGGAEDVATPPADSHWLHEHIPGSELVLIEGAAHISNLERPEVFGDALERHLERN
jgi:3-oxoadipate enol-lactonase